VDNTVKILDLETKIWSKRLPARTGGEVASVRLGHSAVSYDSDRVLLFGGEQEDSAYSNEMYIYRLSDNQWELQECLGDIPSGRARHAATIMRDESGDPLMVVTGGMTKDHISDELFFYDINEKTWYKKGKFVPRYDHTLLAYNNKIWAFGGLSPDMNRVSEVHWYDVDTNTVGAIKIQSELTPSMFPGLHFYGSGVIGTMLDVVLPGTTGVKMSEQSNMITSLDLDSLNWRLIYEEKSQGLFAEHRWYHMFVHNSRLVLLGDPEDSYEERLSHVLVMDLSNHGYMDSGAGANTYSDPSAPPSPSLSLGTIGHDMYLFFKRSEMCDFEITAIEGNFRPIVSHDEFGINSEPIKVHMMVLLARWPHFKRIMASQMSEYHERKMFIPEPVAWVRRLIEYMYRDSIEGYNINEITGLLVLANLYDLPRLRKLCIEAISRFGLQESTAVLIWERSMAANEQWMRRGAASYCLQHWGQIVRTEAFRNLCRESLIALCCEAEETTVVRVDRQEPELDEWEGEVDGDGDGELGEPDFEMEE
jgi:hypothetical protein